MINEVSYTPTADKVDHTSTLSAQEWNDLKNSVSNTINGLHNYTMTQTGIQNSNGQDIRISTIGGDINIQSTNDADEADGSIEIIANQNHNPIPSGDGHVFISAYGDCNIESTEGDMKLETNSGHINIASEVDLNLSSTSGSITFSEASNSTTVSLADIAVIVNYFKTNPENGMQFAA